MLSRMNNKTWKLVLFCAGSILFSHCKTASPAPYLTQQSNFYFEKLELVSYGEGSQVEFILEGAAWQGFQARSFSIQLQLRQSTYIRSKELDYRAVDQPFRVEDNVSFSFPLREVSYGRRGTPEERINLNRDFQACIRLLEWNSEAVLAEQCYSGSSLKLTTLENGIRTVQGPLPAENRNGPGLDSPGEGKDSSDDARNARDSVDPDATDPAAQAWSGSFLSTTEIPGLGSGVLKFQNQKVLWIPATESEPISGTYEVQGELVLVRLSGDFPLLLLKKTSAGVTDLNSDTLLRPVE